MLNPRQKRFCELYHRYGNATRAYGEAYDSPTLDSPKADRITYPNWVSVEAYRTLRIPIVVEFIAKLRGDSAALADMSREETLDYLISAITTPIEDIGPDSPLCEEYEVKPDGTIKTKSVSKIGALKELIRLTGMAAPKRLEVTADSEVKEMLRRLTGAKGEE